MKKFKTLNDFVTRNRLNMPAVSTWEISHMNECRNCREAWLHFCVLDGAHNVGKWSDMGEPERRVYLNRARNIVKKIVADLSTRIFKAYYEFQREYNRSEWNHATKDVKDKYEQIAKNRKESNARALAEAPFYIQKQVKIHRQEQRAASRLARAGKPARGPGTFLLFRRDYFNARKAVDPTLNPMKMQKECAAAWKSATPEVKAKYREICDKAKDQRKRLFDMNNDPPAKRQRVDSSAYADEPDF